MLNADECWLHFQCSLSIYFEWHYFYLLNPIGSQMNSLEPYQRDNNLYFLFWSLFFFLSWAFVFAGCSLFIQSWHQHDWDIKWNCVLSFYYFRFQYRRQHNQFVFGNIRTKAFNKFKENYGIDLMVKSNVATNIIEWGRRCSCIDDESSSRECGIKYAINFYLSKSTTYFFPYTFSFFNTLNSSHFRSLFDFILLPVIIILPVVGFFADSQLVWCFSTSHKGMKLMRKKF